MCGGGPGLPGGVVVSQRANLPPMSSPVALNSYRSPSTHSVFPSPDATCVAPLCTFSTICSFLYLSLLTDGFFSANFSNPYSFRVRWVVPFYPLSHRGGLDLHKQLRISQARHPQERAGGSATSFREATSSGAVRLEEKVPVGGGDVQGYHVRRSEARRGRKARSFRCV